MCKDGQKSDISGICKSFRHIQGTGILRRFLQVISLVYMMYILFYPFNYLQLFLKKSKPTKTQLLWLENQDFPDFLGCKTKVCKSLIWGSKKP